MSPISSPCPISQDHVPSHKTMTPGPQAQAPPGLQAHSPQHQPMSRVWHAGGSPRVVPAVLRSRPTHPPSWVAIYDAHVRLQGVARPTSPPSWGQRWPTGPLARSDTSTTAPYLTPIWHCLCSPSVASALLQGAWSPDGVHRAAEPDMISGDGQTALHYCCKYGYTRVVAVLLDAAADIDQVSDECQVGVRYVHSIASWLSNG